MFSSFTYLTFILQIFALLMLPASTVFAGPGASGGGDATAAQFVEVAQRAGDQIDSICMAALRDKSSDPQTTNACSYGLGLLDGGIYPMIARPTYRKGGPIAVLKNEIVLLNVLRWNDLEIETDPAKIPSARKEQIKWALHMPLVMVQRERKSSFKISNELLELLIKNGVNLETLVNGPSILRQPLLSANTVMKTSVSSGTSPKAIATQFSGVAMSAYKELSSICTIIEQNPSDPRNVDPNSVVCHFMAYPHFTVEPDHRDSILGRDGKPRDAGNNGADAVFLDVDRWLDLQNVEPSMILTARIKQLTIALHETLVLGHQELNDSYLISDQAVNFLLKNGANPIELVGEPAKTISQ